MPSKLEELERLAILRDRGALTDDEFNAEKFKLLNTRPHPSAQAQSAASAQAAAILPPPSKPATATSPLAASRAYEKRLWNFEPITQREGALVLLSAGWFSCWLTVANSSLDFIGDLWTAGGGGLIDVTMSNSETLTYHFVGLAIWSAIVLVTSWLAIQRHSRIAAAFLILLAAFELVAALVARWDGDKILRNAALLFCIPATLLAVQCFRATLALRHFDKDANGGTGGQ